MLPNGSYIQSCIGGFVRQCILPQPPSLIGTLELVKASADVEMVLMENQVLYTTPVHFQNSDFGPTYTCPG